MFSYRNISLSIFSDVKQDLFSATKFPAALKRRSLGTLVAVIHKNLFESTLRYLYNDSRSFHHSSGCLFSKPSGSSRSYFCSSVLATSAALPFSPALGLKAPSKIFLTLYIWVEDVLIVLSVQ